ncbi:MAG: hypothetical protein GX443_01570 [Deltaproteobacteria bacterium]|nr:hypothetical protein [Deltaproteobacteria bacterium]
MVAVACIAIHDAHPAQVTLAWDPPDPHTGVVGYNFYVGTTSRQYQQRFKLGNTLTYTVQDLEEGITYFFAATARDSAERESGFSNEVPYTVPIKGSLSTLTDFNGDGRGDILWHNQVTGEIYASFLDGVNSMGGASITPSAVPDVGWQIRGLADFNGDGKTDFLWQHQRTGQIYVWLMNGLNATVGLPIQVSPLPEPTWQIQAAADFNGDGKTDILWQHLPTGLLHVWIMDGLTAKSSSCLSPDRVTDTQWQIQAAADFNGDGKTDILWQHLPTGLLHVWIMDGFVITAASSPLLPDRPFDPSWQVISP